MLNLFYLEVVYLIMHITPVKVLFYFSFWFVKTVQRRLHQGSCFQHVSSGPGILSVGYIIGEGGVDL